VRREEKDITKLATPLLKEHLLASALVVGGAGASSCTLAVSRVTSCEGTATAVASRGKRKLGFEYTITLGWEMRDAGGAVGASGTLTLDEVADTDSDVFAGMTVTGGKVGGAGGFAGALPPDPAAAVRKSAGHFRDVIRKWAEAVKAL
jgi:hypothetical protein